MPQESPIFSAPDPRSSNLFARYTQEQVPVLPAGYLESFATAAKLRADQANQAAQLAFERQKMSATLADKGADRELDYKKAEVDAMKYTNEGYKLQTAEKDAKAKRKKEEAEGDLKVKEYNDKKLNTGLDILKGRRSEIGQILENNRNEKDPAKKMKPEEVDSLTSQFQDYNAKITAVESVYLDGIGLGNKPATGNTGFAQKMSGQPQATPEDVAANRAYEFAKDKALRVADAKWRASGSTDRADFQKFADAELQVVFAQFGQKKNSSPVSTVNADGSVSVPSVIPGSGEQGGGLFDIYVEDPTPEPQSRESLRLHNPYDLVYPVSTDWGGERGTVGLPSELNPYIENHVNHGWNNGTATAVHSTIVWDEPSASFKTSINPEQKDEHSMKLNRRLELMTWALNKNNGNIDIDIDENDIKAVSSAFGIPANRENISQIAKAWKLVSGMQAMEAGAPYDSKIDFANQTFKEQFGIEPQEFLVGGRGAVSTTSEVTVSDANDIPRQIAANNARITAALNSDNRPTISIVSDNGIPGKIEEIRKKIESNSRALMGDPGETRAKELKAQNIEYTRQVNTLSQELTAIKSQNDTLKLKYDEYMKNVEAVKIETAGLEAQMTAKRGAVALSDEAEKIGRRFPGITTASRNLFHGYVAEALFQITPKVISLPEYDRNGKPTGRTIQNRLTLRELINLSMEKGDPSIIPKTYLYDAPTEEDIKTAKEATAAFDKSLDPIIKLAAISDRIAKENGTGIVSKLLDLDANTAESYRNSIISAIRTSAIGGGNPSNYEQELLQTLVPDPSKIMGMATRDVQRWKNIALINILRQHLALKQSRFKLTDDALKLYNTQLSKVLGKTLKREDLEKLFTAYGNSKTTYDKLYSQGLTKDATAEINKLLTTISSITGV